MSYLIPYMYFIEIFEFCHKRSLAGVVILCYCYIYEVLYASRTVVMCLCRYVCVCVRVIRILIITRNDT